MKMTRIFHNPSHWEDWKNGMYENNLYNKDKKVAKAVYLLSTPHMFENIAKQVIAKWRYSSEHHLTNMGRNRQAWLGQASCCFFAGTPEILTKEAWHQLSSYHRNRANGVADKVILLFERNLIYKYQYSLI